MTGAALPAPATPLADLSHALIHLLSNAVQYNRMGGSVRVVRVVLAAPGPAVLLAVHDTGPGLHAAEMALLFEPFNRLGQARGPIDGTGTGSCFAVCLPGAAPA